MSFEYLNIFSEDEFNHPKFKAGNYEQIAILVYRYPEDLDLVRYWNIIARKYRILMFGQVEVKSNLSPMILNYESGTLQDKFKVSNFKIQDILFKIIRSKHSNQNIFKNLFKHSI